MKKPDIDISALARLARIEVPAEELTKLEKEIPNILSFVATIQKAAGEAAVRTPSHRNVMRDDTNPHESGVFTETLLSAAPARAGERIAVKQVISRKKANGNT